MISDWSRSSKQSHDTNLISTNKSEEALCIQSLTTVSLAKPSFFFQPSPCTSCLCTHPASTSVCLTTFVLTMQKAETHRAAPTHATQLSYISDTIHIYRPSASVVALTNTPTCTLHCRIPLGYLFILFLLRRRSQASAQGRLQHNRIRRYSSSLANPDPLVK
jgi:hypothetical protein